ESTRMVRLCGKYTFQYLTGLERPRITLVSRKNGNGLIDGERIEERTLVIIGIAPVYLFHRGFVGEDTGSIIALLPVLIIIFYRRDVVALARRRSGCRLCLFNGLPPAIERRRIRRAHQRIGAGAYRISPVRHREVGARG